MNTAEIPQTDLQTTAEDGLADRPNPEPEKISFQMASDLNENNFNREQPLIRNTGIDLHHRDAQDSINNNEYCNLMCGQLSCRQTCAEERAVGEGLASASLACNDGVSTQGKRVVGRRSNRNKKAQNGKSTGLSASADVDVSEENKCVDSAHDTATLDSQARTKHTNQKQRRHSLFSLIREGLEQADGRMLPMCLHQIAETYFQEEDYEKAMQFIHLERVYHEQLLANLSAIQEQWKTKWKTTNFASQPSLQNCDTGLSCQELEMLSNICGSHQDPQASKWQLSASDKKMESLDLLKGSDEYNVDGECPDRESGIRRARKPGVAQMTEPWLPDVSTASKLTRMADHHAVPPRKSPTEEQQCITHGPASEAATSSTGTAGRADPDSSFSSGDAGKNNNLLQPEATAADSNVSEIEPLSEDSAEEQAGHPMVGIAASAAFSVGTQGVNTRGCSSIACMGIVHTVHPDSSAEERYSAPGHGVTESLVDETGHCPKGKQKCLEEVSKSPHQTAAEFIASLLNGDLTESENFLAHLDFQEETYSEEEMSPSTGESVLGENLLSLDELAHRIEIEEVSPAAGLVSILKKRNGSEGGNHKQTKRKVRFEETEDVLDQEEMGGGSCILLIALCLATVFLSIGGTALYCTFGDVESSVCKDFTANIDFYYTQAVQGVEELKHWLFIT